MRGKKEHTKLRLLAIERMLSFNNIVTMSQIKRRLELWYGIEADRKTIYSDIAAIDRFMPIEVIPGKYGGYRLVDVLKEVNDSC